MVAAQVEHVLIRILDELSEMPDTDPRAHLKARVPQLEWMLREVVFAHDVVEPAPAVMLEALEQLTAPVRELESGR